MRRPTIIATATTAMMFLAVVNGARAAKLTVGSGSSLDLGTSSLDLGCGDVDVGGVLMVSGGVIRSARHVTTMPSGTLAGGSGTVEVAGDWSNSGSFSASSSTVSFMDGCSLSSSTISGTNAFFDLSLSTTSGKAYYFEAGSSQTVTASLAMNGGVGNLLTLRSTVGGSPALLDLQGSQSVYFVDVDDVDASAGNDIVLGPESVAGPNTPGFVPGAVIPMLGLVGLLLLVASLIKGGVRILAPRQTGH